MSAWAWLAFVATSGLLVWAVYQDWHTRRISNRFLLAAWCLALGWQGWAPMGYHFLHPQMQGGQGVLAALGASALMLAMTFVLWQRHVFGAGDAKLLSVLAAWAGPLLTLPLLLLTLMAGGALALAGLMWPAQRQRLWCVLCGDRPPNYTAAARPLPYAMAIAIGVWCLYLLIGLEQLPLWWYG